MCAPMERQGRGRGGESATKKRRPRLPQRRDGCSLICAQKGRRRPKPNKLRHTTSIREGGKESWAAARARAAAVTARGGRERDGQMRSLGIQRSLGVDGNTGAGIPNACQTIIATINYSTASLLRAFFLCLAPLFLVRKESSARPLLISGVSSVFLSFLPGIAYPGHQLTCSNCAHAFGKEEFFFCLSSCAYSLGGIRS